MYDDTYYFSYSFFGTLGNVVNPAIVPFGTFIEKFNYNELNKKTNNWNDGLVPFASQMYPLIGYVSNKRIIGTNNFLPKTWYWDDVYDLVGRTFDHGDIVFGSSSTLDPLSYYKKEEFYKNMFNRIKLIN